jgi:acyl carrier protein phosphodiesterase
LNYLAHIHLAHASQTSKLGNFLGDFVKGSQLHMFPKAIEKGIRLHRSIDKFTDQHFAVSELRTQFPKSLRRMSGVVIDVYFDHLLCHHWHSYTEHSLPLVVEEFYQELATTQLDVSQRFSKVRQGLLDYRWLSDYKEFDAVIRAYKQIEARLGHKITFADDTAKLLTDKHTDFENVFLQLYPDLIRLVSAAK